jgi:hypothetical protein
LALTLIASGIGIMRRRNGGERDQHRGKGGLAHHDRHAAPNRRPANAHGRRVDMPPSLRKTPRGCDMKAAT